MKNKILAISLLSAVILIGARAQNTPICYGLKIPQLTTEQRDRIQSEAINSSNPYAKGQMVFNLDTGCVEYWNGNMWISLCEKWFYMPSIVFDVSTTGSFSKNLYNEYIKQIHGSGNNVVSSSGAPGQVSGSTPAATDFYYYVTDYDPSVFARITIDENGIMTYDVIDTADDDTFINIVFAKK